jgi:hypothetical protein
VQGNSKLLKVDLISDNGHQLKTCTMTSEHLQAALPRVVPGTYYIKVTGDGISSTQKIIIQ